ncbi:MAG: acyltransferase [Bacteroidota bacterium]|jgi:acetyltransferase-like isoleucine patch superfamily enzyme
MGIMRRLYRLFGKSYYTTFSLGYLLLCWIIQRVFRVNADIPFLVNYTNKISGWKNIRFEDDSVAMNLLASGGAYIAAFENTTIAVGSGTIWAYNICLQTANHVPGNLKEYTTGSIKIGKNCWLGNGVIITAGVELGDNVVVGANAVVTKSFPSNVIIAGVPAQVIKQIEKAD